MNKGKLFICETVQLLSAIVLGLGVSSIVGFLAHRPGFYKWGGATDVGMALKTSIAFTIIGFAVWLLATVMKKHLARCR